MQEFVGVMALVSPSSEIASCIELPGYPNASCRYHWGAVDADGLLSLCCCMCMCMGDVHVLRMQAPRYHAFLAVRERFGTIDDMEQG